MFLAKNTLQMNDLGWRLGAKCRGGEVIELIGDVGVGKTVFVKGIGDAMQATDDIQSPSFTISRIYECADGLELHHYDLYRLSHAGVMSYELAESIGNNKAVTVVEWAETVRDVLPRRRVVVSIEYCSSGEERRVEIKLPKSMDYLMPKKDGL